MGIYNNNETRQNHHHRVSKGVAFSQYPFSNFTPKTIFLPFDRDVMGGESKGGGFRVRYAAEDPTLPPPWRALVDDRTGYLYFWNPKTDVTQYMKPTADDAFPNPNPKSLEEEEEATHHLEKASPEMRAEIAEVNFTSVHKLGGVHSLEASIGDKSQEVEKEFFSLDAKLSEPHSKSSEVDRKLEEGTLERKHQKEVLSSNTEWRTSEMDTEQRAHVLDRGEMPQNGQKRLVYRVSVEGEVRENETDRVRKKQEREFEEEARMMQVTSNSLENKEVDLNIRLRALTLKEKDADIKMMNLENKEKYLRSKEENLNVRERDLQKLVDHNAILSAKMQEFELEMEKKRASFEEEMKNKLDALDEREKEINQKEEHISKREQELESKMNRLKINEKEIGTKSKALESGEESLNIVDKKLEEEKKQLPKDSQELTVSMTELESLKAATETEEQQVTCIKENLKLTEEEGGENLKLFELQSKIKHEIEHMKGSFVKETEALREKREQFEREWELLGEKRIAVETEVKKLDAERERFEKWLCNEKEKLKRVCLQAETDIQRELVDLRLKSDAFENILERERSVAHEFTKRELTDVAQEIDLHKHVLEMNMQRKVEDMVKKLQERGKQLAGVAAQELELHEHELEMSMKKKLEDMEKKFLEEVTELNMRRETKFNNISSSIKLNDFRIQELSEQCRLEEPSTCKKKLETHQVRGKETNTPYVLSRNVKDRHAGFIHERDQFLAAAEPCKTCHNFGVGLSGSEVLGLQPSTETENTNVRLRCLADGCLEGHREGEQTIQSPPETSSQSVGSAGNTSLSQKYSRHFNFTPGQIAQHSTQDSGGKPIQFRDSLDMAASEDLTGSGATHNQSDIRRGQPDGNARSSKELESLDKAGKPSIRVKDTSIDIIMVTDCHSRPAEGETVSASADEQEGTVGSSLPLENHSQPQSSKQQQVQPSSRLGAKTASWTRPVKAATEDANDVLGEISDLRDEEQPNGDAQESQVIDQQSQGGSAGRSRKRKQASTTCGDRRYNLRHSATPNISVASEQAKDLKAFIDEIVKGDHVGDSTAMDEAAISPLTG